MSAELSPLHDTTESIMNSVAVTIMYPLIHYACVAFKRVYCTCSLRISDLRVGEGTCMAMSLYKLKATAEYL